MPFLLLGLKEVIASVCYVSFGAFKMGVKGIRKLKGDDFSSSVSILKEFILKE